MSRKLFLLDPAASRLLLPPTRLVGVPCSCYRNSGWEWPNLGVNCPAGSATAICAAATMFGCAWIRCQRCNADGSKPAPERLPGPGFYLRGWDDA